MARVSIKNVGRWVPGIAMLARYEKSWLRSDLVAGVVLAAILVPQGMAYAELAGLPAVNGLYTTVACLVGYAIFGPSRVLVLGPDSSLGPLIFAAILPLAVTDNPTELVAFAGFLALLVGAIEVGLGIGKLGFVADLLSKEVQVGYMMGLGVTIVVGQLPKLFGFSTDGDDFIEDVKAFVSGLDQRNRDTLIVGVAALALMLVLPRFTSRIPAVLITVILSTLAVSVFDLTSKGVTTVGSLPQGFPRPQIPSVDLGDVGALLAAAVGITLVSLADTIATSTSFAARRGDEVNASQEMIGIGAANAFAGLFQGFPISTSGSRTAVAEKSGAKSQVTGLVGAALVVVMLVLLPDLLSNLPNSALAAIVIAAALSLMDVTAATKFFRIRKSSFVLMLTATLGVIFFGVLEGILIAVALSILMFFRRSWWPQGRDPRQGRLARLLAQHPQVPRGDAGPGGRRLPVGGAALLRQRGPVPAGDQVNGQEAGHPLGRHPVRGGDRHRRDGRRHARATRQGAQCPGRQHAVRRAAEPPPRSRYPLRLARDARPHALLRRGGRCTRRDRPGRLIVLFSPSRREDLDDREAEERDTDAEDRPRRRRPTASARAGRCDSRPSRRSRRQRRPTRRVDAGPAS